MTSTNVFHFVLDHTSKLLTDSDCDFIRNYVDIDFATNEGNIHSNYTLTKGTYKNCVFSSKWLLCALCSSTSSFCLIVGQKKLLSLSVLAAGTFLILNEYRRQRKKQMILNDLKELFLLWRSFSEQVRKILQFLKELELVGKGFMFPIASLCSASNAEPGSENPLLCIGLRTNIYSALTQMCQLMEDCLALVRSSLSTVTSDLDSHYLLWRKYADRFPFESAESLTCLKELFNFWCILCSQLCRQILLGVSLPKNDNVVQASLEALVLSCSNVSRSCFTEVSNNFRYYISWKSDESVSKTFKKVKEPLGVLVQSIEVHLSAMRFLTGQLSLEETEPLDIDALVNKIQEEKNSIDLTIDSLLTQIRKKPIVSSPVKSVELKPLYLEEEPKKCEKVVDGQYFQENEDEVLEAYNMDEGKDDFKNEELFFSREEFKKLAMEHKMQSSLLLTELRNVLKHKAQDWAEREAKALMKRYKKDLNRETQEADIDTDQQKEYLVSPRNKNEEEIPADILYGSLESTYNVESDPGKDKDFPAAQLVDYDSVSRNVFFGVAQEAKSLFASRSFQAEEILGDEASSSDDDRQ
ncbi:uncharacterized protein LOC136028730 isoform X1 [Artemia franciscana]|uniref:Myosin-binding domain-containing protein n=1 Tax=Artemia franciscana TaxID=6661 RepID=A0AA88IH80_ARTSF|nr:hypothetical protein QYM36_007598 [Artemia franciscana]